jgi:hypothetical protein
VAFQLTDRANRARQRAALEPSLVLEIDGVSTLFGVDTVQEYIRIGDTGLAIDGSWTIGGLREATDQLSAISFEGTGSTISQQLLQDKGGTSSVSSLAISLIDFDGTITELVTPGSTVDDILGRRAYVMLGFADTAYPQDYIQVFSGLVDEVVTGGTIVLNIAHPDAKKRQTIFPNIKAKLDGAINGAVTTITLDDVSGLLSPADSGTLTCYIRVDDEVIGYAAIDTGLNQLTGCTRGQLGTTAAAHDDETDVSSFYRLQGDAITLALKLLLSSEDTYYLEGVSVDSFVRTPGDGDVPNAIYFYGFNVTSRYGVVAGDLVTTTGATNAANDVTLAEVTEVVETAEGSYIVLGAESLVVEEGTSATISLSSQYNALPTGLGLGGDQVDVTEFEWVQTTFPGSLPDYDFYLTEDVDGRQFVDTQILFPAACFSIPRNGRVSVGFTSPPLSTDELVELDASNVTRPDQIKVKRSVNRYLYNAIVYRYEKDVDGEYRAGLIAQDADSTSRIPVGNKVLRIDSDGLRASAGNSVMLEANSERLLDRYKFAAETFQFKAFFGDVFNVDVGDVVLFGDPDLQIVDSKSGTREFVPRLCEVVNKSMNIKTGECELTVLDTNYATNGRFGVISPSSVLDSGATTTVLPLTISYGWAMPYERTKWTQYVGERVLIRAVDWSTSEETTITGVGQVEDTLLVEALGSPPAAGSIVELAPYSTDADPEVDALSKRAHASFNPVLTVTGGTSATQFAVSAPDAAKLFVGCTVRVSSSDYVDSSGEVEVTEISGTDITVGTALGFTPSAGDIVELIGFANDEGAPYRWV